MHVLSVRVPAVGAGRRPLVRLRALVSAAARRGGAVVAWNGETRVAFAFPPSAPGGDVRSVLELFTEPGTHTDGEELPLAAALARGALEPLADPAEVPSIGTLAAGAALTAATALARAARGGELVISQDLARDVGLGLALRGRVRAEVDDDGVRTVIRGARVRLDAPFRDDVALGLSRLRVPPLVAIDPAAVPLAPSSLTVVRADPGAGGSRLLAELAARAPRALSVAPTGAGLAPMGAMRRAVERSITRDLGPKLVALAEPLDALLSGEPVDVDTVATLACAFFATKTGRHDSAPPGTSSDVAPRTSLILVDDAASVDAASLEAAARSAARAGLEGNRVALVVRLGAEEPLPPAFAALPRIAEITLGPLSPEDARAVANACASGALDEAACATWAERGARTPLGIVSALECAVAKGALALGVRTTGPRASTPPAANADAWIAERAALLDPASALVVSVVALFGGEAKQTRIARVLEDLGAGVDVERALEVLVREKWLEDVQEDWVGVPSRSHGRVLEGLLPDDERARIHAAIGRVLREDEGAFGRAELGWHAAAEGDGRRGAKLLLDAARAAAGRGLEASAIRLVSFARELDPSIEELARETLAMAAASSGVVSSVRGAASAGSASEKLLAAVPEPPRAGRATSPSFPETPALPFTPEALPPSVAPPPNAQAAEVASRIGELARDAILSDGAGLERWVAGVSATGDKPLLAERMRAIARIGRGEIGDALRVLRRMRDGLAPDDHALRCQTSLALGITLSAGGRPQEALLEGLDALARARAGGDERGTRACLAFLAKLYASVGRSEDSERLGALVVPG